MTLIPWRPLQNNLLRMLTLERFATATLCRMGDILRRLRLIDGNFETVGKTMGPVASYPRLGRALKLFQ